jgi:ClpP class serine protease
MWLLNDEALRGMRSFAHARTAADLRAFEAAVAAEPQASAPRNLKVAGNVAEISVDGVLTEKPDFLAWLFGGGFSTTYESIRAALASAQADSAVKEIVMNVNSPGGNVNGLFETLAAIEAVSKPIRVRASQAASAAYAIAASAGRIEAVGPASSFGSIGVATSIYVDDSIVDIASTEAPNKRPDVSTPEGKAVVQGELDAIHELFADSIARGRATTTGNEDIDTDFVNANFGRGGVLLAAEAKKRKMIDSYPKPAGRASRAKNATAVSDGGQDTVTDNNSGDTEHMTREQLKAAHPEVYAAIVAEGEAAGEARGVAGERDRVTAHLTMGEASGDMKTALSAIADGSGMTASLQAKYLAAGMNRSAIVARETEGAAAAAVTAGATPAVEGSSAGAAPEGGKDFGDLVADAVDAKLGRKPKA